MKRSVIRCVLAVCLASAFASTVAQEVTPEVRDPFSPFLAGTSAAPGAVAGDEALPPLLKFPLEQYAVVGIMTSQRKGVAIVQTPIGSSFYLRKGDALGAEGFVVTAMRSISVEFKDKSGNTSVLIARPVGSEK